MNKKKKNVLGKSNRTFDNINYILNLGDKKLVHLSLAALYTSPWYMNTELSCHKGKKIPQTFTIST